MRTTRDTSVDLPDPEGPTSATCSPGSTVRLITSTPFFPIVPGRSGHEHRQDCGRGCGLHRRPLGKATSPEEQERQAEALAGLKGSIISAWVSAQYPDAELYTDVALG